MLDPQAVLDSDKVQALHQMAVGAFRERAAAHDKACTIPTENIDDLFRSGWLNACLSKEFGGMASNLDTDDPCSYLQAIRVVARGCSSTAHCLQVHNHTAWCLEQNATPGQKEHFLKRMAERPFLVSGVGSEPNRKHMYTMMTTAKPVDGGYRVNGVKNYATNGPAMGVAVIFAALEGVEDYRDNHIMLLVEPGTEGFRVDPDWYRPLGMRAANSPMLYLDDVFVPTENVLGEPGAYPRGRWQGKYHLGFAANYLGTAEGMFDFYRDYIVQKGKGRDAITQMRTGEMKIALEAAQALFHRAILAWKTQPVVEAELISMSAKYTAAQTALELTHKLIQAAGSTVLFETFPIGRMIRDVETHCLHAGHDRTAQIIGQSLLGDTFDSTLQR